MKIHGYGVAEALPVFQAGWSDCMYFSLSLIISFAHLEFPRTLLFF
jgi:hypothetical protein